MTELSTTGMLAAKSTAMEIVMLALMRACREDKAFWERIELVTAFVLSQAGHHAAPNVPMLADRVQDFLDSWRQAVAQDGQRPAPP